MPDTDFSTPSPNGAFVTEWPPPAATDDGGPYAPDRIHPAGNYSASRLLSHSAAADCGSPATAHHLTDTSVTNGSDNTKESG